MSGFENNVYVMPCQLPAASCRNTGRSSADSKMPYFLDMSHRVVGVFSKVQQVLRFVRNEYVSQNMPEYTPSIRSTELWSPLVVTASYPLRSPAVHCHVSTQYLLAFGVDVSFSSVSCTPKIPANMN